MASESFHYRLADRQRIRLRKFATEQWPDGIGRRITNDLPLKVSAIFSPTNSKLPLPAYEGSLLIITECFQPVAVLGDCLILSLFPL